MPDIKKNHYDEKSDIYNNHFIRSQRKVKKKRSWISLIIQFIVLILIGITGYSMYKQPIFNLVLADQPVNYEQIKTLQDTVTQIGALNINLSQLANFEDITNRLVLIFNVYFMLVILSMIIAIITIIFNRTLLKILNFIVITILLVMSLYFSYAIQMIGQRIADKLQSYALNINANQIIVEADAIHNALILLVSSLALLIISLFFRNRYPRLR
ncbi:hypothetical protein [Staphylococcus devriesei]|uniref:hypothetical protein n=1 Tax=Staphylococcus devriesei TaxID=586733 RepID=UPI001F3333FA|nr:hypothetical protein [Staphylococcus devriesei]MCE5090112.1 hypothetical protein [Staphylococcus devriesei]